MAAMLAGCPDDGTPVTTIGDTSSSDGGEESNTNATVTQTTTMDTTADTTADTSGSDSSDTDVSTTRTTTDTDSSTSTDATAESSSSGDGGPVCGDDVADKGEECDGTDLAGQDCAGQGFDAGTLSCADDCTFDTSQCTVNCGNGTIEAPEACDGVNLDGEDCLTQGFDAGTLGCALDCQFDTSACVMFSCGDGMINGGELCDGADVTEDCVSQGFDGGTLGCAGNCMAYDTTQCFNGFPCQDADLGSVTGASVASGNLGGEDDDINASCGGGGGADRVLAWTAPAAGIWTFDTATSDFDTKLAIYTDCSTEIGCNDDFFGVQSQVQSDLAAGQEILIVVDGFNGSIGNWVLNITPPPVCGDGVTGAGETCDGADLAGQDCLSQGFGGGGVLACAGDCGSFDTSGCISAFCGDDVAQVPEACDGPDLAGQTCIELGVSPSGTVSNCCFAHAAGCDDAACQTTVCAADPFCCNNSWDNICAREGAELCDPALCPDPTCTGTCTFDTSTCNADLAACIEDSIASNTGPSVSTGTTVGEDENIAQACGGGGSVDHVINFIVPADGTYTFDLVGSSYDTVLSLSTGCGAPFLCNDDSIGLISAITTDLTAGQQISIAVSGFGGNTGNYVLNITPPAPAVCDSGTDPGSGAPYVVCAADATSAWVSMGNEGIGGNYHPVVICQSLGYDTVGQWGGTCGNVCGYCEASTACDATGLETFDAGDWTGTGNCTADGLGEVLCTTVQWTCI